tara:strand:+ start:3893 stop:4621 length:729 start_codon:yes stop_codon:yes gene_type:complete
MIKVCTVYHKGLYTPDYVGKFYRALKRNSSVNFQRVCISDDPNVEADWVLPLNPHSNIKYHWHKLKFFSPDFAYQTPDDDIIIMDIDQVITGNVDELLKWPVKNKELLTYEAWWDGKLKKNGGFYKFKSGTLMNVWDRFSLNPEYWQLHFYNEGIVHKKYYGEQNFVYNTVRNIKTVPGEWLFKYTNDSRENLELQMRYCQKYNVDYAIMGNVNKKIKIVHFAGPGKTIHDHKEDFIKENWI